VDGAKAWQTLIHVTVPYIRGTLIVAGVLRLIDSIKAFPPQLYFTPTFANYQALWETEFRHSFLNSLVTSTASTAISMVVGVPAAYALARIRSRSNALAPGLAATAILCFVYSWNDFFFALILTRTDAMTAPVAVVNFMNYEGWDRGRIAAGGAMVMLPVLVFSLLVRRFLIEGLTAGAVKG
jgi:ABC-type glycerol-3-phosphate transport system permease component